MPAIIGTAGHIDHGKTALIRALTGQDTDRLKEEKERGISIDLGFAYFELSDGSRAGIVDVPGHERFIRNMLAGAHGMDLVLLVVAADDGVMPQTEEHLDILHLLGVDRGIAVISKCDLASSERVREVREEVYALLSDTRLAGAPIVEVSSATGAGIDELRAQIELQVRRPLEREDGGVFRMPIDRCFVMRGHGVVVTGTAISGEVKDGAMLRLLPGGEECRVRGLQVHGEQLGEARAGQRVAINLAGVEKTEVRRGHVLVDLRFRRSTRVFDASLEIRPGDRTALKNHALVRVHLGSAAVLGRVHLLGRKVELRPSEKAYCQIVLDEEVAAVFGDRFVVRDETVQRTFGGGVILQPLARRHRDQDVAESILSEIDHAQNLASRLIAIAASSDEPIVSLDWLLQLFSIERQAIVAALSTEPRFILLPAVESLEAVALREEVERLEKAILMNLAAHHRNVSLALGAEMESTRTLVAPQLSAKLFRAVVDRLERRKAVVRSESLLHLPGHAVAMAAPEQELAERAVGILEAGGLAPPDLRELGAALKASPAKLADVLVQLERQGRAARIAPSLFFSSAALERARGILTDYLREHGEISAAIFRDLIRGSRKFSIALLDYFDRTGFTIRVGDVRRLGRAAKR